MKQEYVLRPANGAHEIRFELLPQQQLQARGRTQTLTILRREENGFVTALLGTRVIHGFIHGVNGELLLTLAGRTEGFALRPAALDSMRQGMLRAAAQGGTIELKSPIPGLIKAVRAETGAAIEAGETLAILEAMKMENEIRAPHAGTIERVCAVQGQNVAAGAILFAIKTR
jgi:acetyl/propionyl-CoA carboxylase alpha subunit